MIASLRDDDISCLCNDDTYVSGLSLASSSVRSGGPLELTRCFVGPDVGTLDIGLVRADKARAAVEGTTHEVQYSEGNRPIVLNFLVERSDGRIFSMHPKPQWQQGHL